MCAIIALFNILRTWDAISFCTFARWSYMAPFCGRQINRLTYKTFSIKHEIFNHCRAG